MYAFIACHFQSTISIYPFMHSTDHSTIPTNSSTNYYTILIYLIPIESYCSLYLLHHSTFPIYQPITYIPQFTIYTYQSND